METPKINPLSNANVNQVTPQGTASGQATSLTKGFKQILDSLNEDQATTDDLIKKLAAGEDVSIHQVMIAMEETDINFRVTLAIRDRLVEAYREVSRMQV